MLWRTWRAVLALGLAALALYLAVARSDVQGRADLPYGYAVRMTCEDDPESHLWSGGCERIAADIARTGSPSFFELYRAFVTVHHTQRPSAATTRRFAGTACTPGFEIAENINGTRAILSPDLYAGVCNPAHAQAIRMEMDDRDRALLTIERAGLSWSALAAGALANLTEPVVLFAGAAVVLALWIL
jgi:hypothetical protein